MLCTQSKPNIRRQTTSQFVVIVMSGTKRTISELLDTSDATSQKRRQEIDNDDEHTVQTVAARLNYPAPTALAPRAPAFQRPTQLLSFSYSPERVLEFTNAALKYFVQPPIGSDLSYRYETWVKRPEERGRLDGLLQAVLRKEARSEWERANVVSWRGIMTK